LFSTFRSLSEAVHGLSRVLRDAVALQKDAAQQKPDTALLDRIEELERSRALWEAEMQGEILKADSLKKSALNAESRARTMLKSYESNADEGFTDGPPGAPEGGEFPQLHAYTGEEEGLQPVRDTVETSIKELATRAKFS
jgi:hypothetical protein